MPPHKVFRYHRLLILGQQLVALLVGTVPRLYPRHALLKVTDAYGTAQGSAANAMPGSVVLHVLALVLIALAADGRRVAVIGGGVGGAFAASFIRDLAGSSIELDLCGPGLAQELL